VEPEEVLISPVISEKSYALSAVGRYTFRVHPRAHRTQIRQAVEALYDVKVESVRTINVKPKPKRRGYTAGKTIRYKKAIVQVAEGQSIPVFQGLEQELEQGA